ncbi:hypothetical protein NH340_JMT08095 [Sarcoptes scabiei]|nr:hypothetical protein NH340_JMT08095 [Sarcoptes scabiei]
MKCHDKKLRKKLKFHNQTFWKPQKYKFIFLIVFLSSSSSSKFHFNFLKQIVLFYSHSLMYALLEKEKCHHWHMCVVKCNKQIKPSGKKFPIEEATLFLLLSDGIPQWKKIEKGNISWRDNCRNNR